MNPNIADPGPGAFFGSSQMPNMPMNMASQQQQQPRRREMKGPTGVDDILRTFEEVRRAEESPTTFVPPPPMPDQRPAVVAASEIQSQVSADELGSIATGKTGTNRRGNNRGRGRQQVQNELTLDV